VWFRWRRCDCDMHELHPRRMGWEWDVMGLHSVLYFSRFLMQCDAYLADCVKTSPSLSFSDQWTHPLCLWSP
jgi:hypothetical protein